MYKKRLLSIALVAALTVSSTAIITFASQNADSSTKNIVKAPTDKEQTDIKDYSIVGDTYAKNSSTENNDKTELKLLDISNEKATQIAKDAIKYYTGLDIEKVIKRDGLEPHIDRSYGPYAWGPNILVSFYKKGDYRHNIVVCISAVDGKVYNVTAIIGWYPEVKYNDDKVKQAAASFLQDKGFGGNFTSLTVDDEKISIGIVGAEALYEDGTQILMQFKASDYSIFNFTHYNKKTMKFAN